MGEILLPLASPMALASIRLDLVPVREALGVGSRLTTPTRTVLLATLVVAAWMMGERLVPQATQAILASTTPWSQALVVAVVLRLGSQAATEAQPVVGEVEAVALPTGPRLERAVTAHPA
jgi:hypothetical protein